MRYQRTVLTGATLVAALALVGCGSSDDTGNADESGNQSEAKVVEVADQPGSVDDYVGALEDVELETCSAGGQGLDVAGTVTNPESVAQDYRIYVSAMSADDTVGLVQVDVADVAGGETTDWDTQLHLTQDEVECVLRVERFSSE